MQRIYLDELGPIAPPARGTNGWVLRSRRRIMYATSEGFLEEDADGLYRLLLIDAPVRILKVAGGGARADASEWRRGERVWRLPPAHVRMVLDTHVFAPRAMGPVRLAVCTLDGRPHDAYLEVDEGVGAATLDEDARTLLSGLKSCAGYIVCSQPR